MNRIKEILQTYFVIVLVICHVSLVTRFMVDFLNIEIGNPLLQLVYNTSTFLQSPFESTFESSITDTYTINYSIVLAIIIYSLIGAIGFYILKIIFNISVRNKSLELVNLFFKIIEGTLLLRLVMKLLNAGNSPFSNFVFKFTELFLLPLRIISIFNVELSLYTKIVIAMLVLGIIWYTIYKLLEGLTESVSNLEHKKFVKKAEINKNIEKRKLITSLEPATEFDRSNKITKDKLTTTETVDPISPPQKVEQKPSTKKSFISKIKKYIDDLAASDVEESKNPFEKISKSSKKEKAKQSPLS